MHKNRGEYLGEVAKIDKLIDSVGEWDYNIACSYILM